MRIFLMLVAASTFTTAVAAPSKSAKASDATKIALVKSLVAESFKDPESARFRAVAVKWEAVCGQVNAKNGYGGYVGYKRFYAIEAVDVHIEGSRFSEEQWERFCGPNAKKPAPPAPYHEQWIE